MSFESKSKDKGTSSEFSTTFRDSFSGAQNNEPTVDIERKIDRMVFEVDENVDGMVSWDEFQLMFFRNVNDESGLEPFELFNLVEFLVCDEDMSNSVTDDELIPMLVARYGDKHVQEYLNDLKAADDGDCQFSYEEYLQIASKRPSLKELRQNGRGLTQLNSIHRTYELVPRVNLSSSGR